MKRLRQHPLNKRSPYQRSRYPSADEVRGLDRHRRPSASAKHVGGAVAFVIGSAALVREFFFRELRTRFAGSISGGLWALLQPLVQLGVYAFAFVYIFRAAIPGENPPEFLPFLAVAMWPWFAFSEAVIRATTVIQENAPLIGKVAIPRATLVVASVAASFAVHMVGFLCIVAALAFAGKGIALAGLPLAMLLFVPLAVLAMGFALLFAALQVFVRDLAQVQGQLMTMLMFAAPILYARASMPERFQSAMDFHPFTFYAEASRSLLLSYGNIDNFRAVIAVAVAGVMLLLGAWVFRRLDPHFEDFL